MTIVLEAHSTESPFRYLGITSNACSSDLDWTEVAIPLLFVSAEDDPVVNPKFMPIDVPEKNENVIVVMTKRGGHLGFLEGWWPTGQNWSDRLMVKFLSTCAEMNLPNPRELLKQKEGESASNNSVRRSHENL
jgi:hypothetical protein